MTDFIPPEVGHDVLRDIVTVWPVTRASETGVDEADRTPSGPRSGHRSAEVPWFCVSSVNQMLSCWVRVPESVSILVAHSEVFIELPRQPSFTAAPTLLLAARTESS